MSTVYVVVENGKVHPVAFLSSVQAERQARTQVEKVAGKIPDSSIHADLCDPNKWLLFEVLDSANNTVGLVYVQELTVG